MRILLCTDALGYGGAETHLISLATELALRGHDVTVAAPRGELAGALPDMVTFVPLPPFERSLWGLLTSRRSLARLLRRGAPTPTAQAGKRHTKHIHCRHGHASRTARVPHRLRRRRFDIVHAHARLPALLLRGPARCRRIPLVVTAHAMFRMTPLLARISVWGDRTIAVSEDIRKMLMRRCGLSASRVTVIPNGIDTARFSPAPSSDGEAAEVVAPDFPRIIFVSRLDRDCSSAARELCRLAGRLRSRYPRASVTIVGGGRCFGELASLAELMNAACGARVVDMAGARGDVWRLEREADIFVGVSRAAMEAAACGLPVILAGDEGYGGIFCPDAAVDAANLCARGGPRPSDATFSLAEALFADICRLADMSPAARHRLGLAGRNHVVLHHSAAAMAERTLEVYAAAAGVMCCARRR